MSDQGSEKQKAPTKDKAKPGFFERVSKRISKFFREMRSELKKVVWPTPKQLANNTLIVILCVVAVGLVVAGLDLLFTWGTTAVYALRGQFSL